MEGATRRGTADPKLRGQNTRQERGQGKGENRKSHREEEDIGAQTEAARQSRAALHATRKDESSTRARGLEITVATHNVRTAAVDKTHGVERALDF